MLQTATVVRTILACGVLVTTAAYLSDDQIVVDSLVVVR